MYLVQDVHIGARESYPRTVRVSNDLSIARKGNLRRGIVERAAHPLPSPMKFRVPFILASRSPRRSHLLAQLGFDFEVQPSEIDETVSDTVTPVELVRTLAFEKASAVSRARPESLVLAADTIVVLDDIILGKPGDAAEARAMLRSLSDATHTVYSGIALIHRASRRAITGVESTRVTFDALSEEEIEEYVEGGSPMDKAGSYGIQDDRGALFVKRIEGDYYNVVGLPLHRLYRMLRADFSDLLIGR